MATRVVATASTARRAPGRDARAARARRTIARTKRVDVAATATRRDATRARDARRRARSSDASDDARDGDDAESSDDGLSSSFADEVARRGRARASTTRDDATNPFDDADDGDAPKPPRFAPNPSARRRAREDDQLARSRALQSEGLEGFPARATELLKTGFAVFLGFGPFVAAISVVFCVTYLVFGSDFIHAGEGYGAPAFVPAEVLLGEPTVDPMVPFASGDAAR